MVIFNSYVKLPEGINLSIFICTFPPFCEDASQLDERFPPSAQAAGEANAVQFFFEI
jgi:hypothetical protein